MKKTQILGFCTVGLGLFGLMFWLFLSGCSYSISEAGVEGSSSAFGCEMIFGGNLEYTVEGITDSASKAFKFSVLFVGFIAAIAGIVASVLAVAGVKTKVLSIVALSCFVVAALFCFLTKIACNPIEGGREALKQFHLGIGAILGGICFVGAGVTSILPVVLKEN